jgi:hypothetical protein
LGTGTSNISVTGTRKVREKEAKETLEVKMGETQCQRTQFHQTYPEGPKSIY